MSAHRGFALALVGLSIVALALFWTRSPRRPPIEKATVSAAQPSSEVFESTPAERPDGCFLGAVVALAAVDVAAEVSGVIAHVDLRVGDSARLGQAIAQLDTRELRHALEVEKAQLRQVQAEGRKLTVAAEQTAEEYRRRVALGDLVSREEQEAARLRHQQAIATAEAGSAEEERAAARIAELEDRIQRSTLRAPFAGRIAQRYLDQGARVDPGTPVVRLLGSDKRLVRFAVPPERLPELPLGTKIKLKTVAPPIELEATIDQIAPEIDPESLLVFIEAGLNQEPPANLPLGAEAWVACR